MTGFKCPFCGEIIGIDNTTLTTLCLNFSGFITPSQFKHAPYRIGPYLEIRIYKCHNDKCNQETIIAQGRDGYMNNTQCFIHPKAIYRHFPDYVPQAIRDDYEEACCILDDSPKAAATLARRCLQGMIHDFWGIHEKNLNAEITALQDKIPFAQWQAIDALRKIGNIGAHMEKDTQLIIDVEPDEAAKLLQLIELLIDKWYIARHDEEELYKAITEAGNTKAKARKS